VSTGRTRVEHDFDPGSVREMKASANRDLTVGGAKLAAQAFKAGLVDECHLFVRPVLLGGGKAALPSGIRAELELLDDRRVGNGVVYLRYLIAT
jgi:dihydrofolate reductase